MTHNTEKKEKTNEQWVETDQEMTHDRISE